VQKRNSISLTCDNADDITRRKNDAYALVANGGTTAANAKIAAA